VLGGSAVLEDATGGPRKRLAPGDIVLLFHGGAHVLHDGSGPRRLRRTNARV
jgi:AraC family transcriptional activator of mtrCDE